MNSLSKESVTFITIDESHAEQRLDNFLFTQLKGVPKSHIYRIIRGGEIRINKKRVKQVYRLQIGDIVRIPPIRTSQPKSHKINIPKKNFDVIYEDDALLAINKPAGTAVHGGSGVSFGVIEQLRSNRPESKYLELVHRLDKDTSGILLIAKKRSALKKLHEIMRLGLSDKRYYSLVLGCWKNQRQHIRLPLYKFNTPQGEKRVIVRDDGQSAHTIFNLQQSWAKLSLLEAELKTGRTHQIRVHLAASGFPIAGDEKYGDFERNKQLNKQGLKRMFLHAHRISFNHPLTDEPLTLNAPMPDELSQFIQRLNQDKNQINKP